MLQICLIGILLAIQMDSLEVFNDTATDVMVKANVVAPTTVSESIHSIDTVYTSFESDTINLAQPSPVSQIIYAEHTESQSFFHRNLFPIIMLIIGVIIDRSAQAFFDKKRMERNGNRWKNELQSCAPAINKQQKALVEFKKEYCDNPKMFEIPDIFIFPFLNGKEFSSLNKEDLYDYLKLNIKKHDTCKYILQNLTKDGRATIDELAQSRFYKITTFVMSLEIINRNFINSFDSFRESSSHQIESFNDIQLHYSQILLSYNRERQTPLVCQLMNLYETAFRDHPNINLFELEESFITPSLSFLSKTTDPEYQDIVNQLINMRYCINGLKLEKKYLAAGIQGIIDQYNRCLTAIEEFNDYLKS